MEQLGRLLNKGGRTPRSESRTSAPSSPRGRSRSDAHPLRVVPLGGLGEIGKNMLALEYGDDIIVIDAGIMFPEEDMPGVDLVLPDITYLLERQDKVRAILITHGHEDHTGGLPFVLRQLKVPVYAPRLAHGLIEVKLREHRGLRDSELHQATPGEPLQFGAFEVTFFRVCHSIPDAMGLAIRTPLGTVVHTGDFKIDHTPVDGLPTDFTHLGELAAEGVLLLLSDSTYAEHAGYTPSEMVVSDALDRIIGDAPGRVIVATFASLISRVQQVIDAAHRHNRFVAVLGRSMVENVKMAQRMGYLKAPEGILHPWDEVRSFPPSEVVVVTTGTQGEPTSGLVRVSNRTHRDIEVLAGDTIVISATPIPGNEVLISRTIDNLLRQGAQVLHGGNALVHVHGHAAQEELKLVLRMTRPRFFVPVHGEYRHLIAHAGLARDMGVEEENVFVLEDGHVLELGAEEGSVVDRFPCGHVFVDGRRIWPADSPMFRERQTLATQGLVLVVLSVDGANSHHPLRLVASGFLDGEEHEELLARGAQAIDDALNAADSRDWEAVEKTAQKTLARFLYNETRRRPAIRVLAVEE